MIYINKLHLKTLNIFENAWFGGARRDRTADLYNAIVALSQLSYSPDLFRTPTCGVHIYQNLNLIMVNLLRTSIRGESVNRYNKVDKPIWNMPRLKGTRKVFR